jgi:hypothetical protein
LVLSTDIECPPFDGYNNVSILSQYSDAFIVLFESLTRYIPIALCPVVWVDNAEPMTKKIESFKGDAEILVDINRSADDPYRKPRFRSRHTTLFEDGRSVIIGP